MCTAVRRDFGRVPPTADQVVDKLVTKVIVDPASRETDLMFLDPVDVNLAMTADWQESMLHAATHRTASNAVTRILF